MTRTSPLEDLRTFLDAPWIYLGYPFNSIYWHANICDFDEIREQLFAEWIGWA